MATPQVSNDSSSLDTLLKLFTVANSASGTGKTTTTTSASPGDTAASDQLLQQLMAGGDPATMDALVSNILTQAKQQFSPALFQGSQAGSYNSSALNQMQNEAMARATAAAAGAKLDYQAKTQATAANLVAARMNSNRTQVSQTGASPLGSFIGKISPLLTAYSGLKTGSKLLTGKETDPLKAIKDFLNPDASSELSGLGTPGGTDLGSGALPGTVDSSGANLGDVGFNAFGDATSSLSTGAGSTLNSLDASTGLSAGASGADAFSAGTLGSDAISASALGADAAVAGAGGFDAVAAGLGTTAAVAEGFSAADAALAVAAWVICTEAVAQGLMKKELYNLEAPMVLKRLSPVTIAGYHVLAIPVVKLMRKNKFVAMFFAYGANQYANWIVFMKPSIFGLILRTFGELLCWITGTLYKQNIPDYRQLYSKEVV